MTSTDRPRPYWREPGTSAPTGDPATVSTLTHSMTFARSAPNGDMSGAVDGLFHWDRQFLDRFTVKLDGQTLELSEEARTSHFETTFVGLHESSEIEIYRTRTIDGRMIETIKLVNRAYARKTVVVTIDAAATYSHVWDVKARIEPTLVFPRPVDEKTLEFAADSTDLYKVRLSANHPVDMIDRSMCFVINVPGGGEFDLEVTAEIMFNGEWVTTAIEPAVMRDQLFDRLPAVSTSVGAFDSSMSVNDNGIAAVLLADPDVEGRLNIAAGAPWYMRPFGRDGQIVARQLMGHDPKVVRDLMMFMPEHLGVMHDDDSEQDPGKGFHELLPGEAGTGSSWRKSRGFFGSVDSTFLWMTNAELAYEWGHITAADVEGLLPAMDRVLDWALLDGDPAGLGFVGYEARATSDAPHQAFNQGWIDASDALVDENGELVEVTPVYLSCVNAYYYGALVARSRFASVVGDLDGATLFAAAAAEIKARFNECFWNEEGGFYVSALDGNGKQIRSLTSQNGHVLAYGIATPERAERVATALMSTTMFNGYLIRTLDEANPAYHPIGYHRGAAWIHDNVFALEGFRNYGLEDAYAKLSKGMLDFLTSPCGVGLHEVVSGAVRVGDEPPRSYPASSFPQAWAAAATRRFMTVILGLEPNIDNGTLDVEPSLPEGMTFATLDGVHMGSSRIAITGESAAVVIAAPGAESIDEVA